MDEATRWRGLFADLEAQLDAAEDADLAVEVRDRTRGEIARLRLVDRLAPAAGHPVAVQVAGAGTLRGTLEATGPDWLLLAGPGSAEVLVPLSSVLSLTGLGARSGAAASEGQVAARLGLGHALRGLARSRAAVALTTVDGAVAHGTLDRVGADFVELAEHPPGEARRAAGVAGVRTVPFPAIAAVAAR